LRLTDFSTAKSDDVAIILVSAEDAAGAMDAKHAPAGSNLGKLQANETEQRFVVPADADVTKLTEVVVYETKENQVYGVAKLEAF
jgi:Electron transfer DM13